MIIGIEWSNCCVPDACLQIRGNNYNLLISFSSSPSLKCSQNILPFSLSLTHSLSHTHKYTSTRKQLMDPHTTEGPLKGTAKNWLTPLNLTAFTMELCSSLRKDCCYIGNRFKLDRIYPNEQWFFMLHTPNSLSVPHRPIVYHRAPGSVLCSPAEP